MEIYLEVEWQEIFRIIIVLFLTFLITFFIGFERQNTGKYAGISAHVLVSLGACSLAILQQYMYFESIRMANLMESVSNATVTIESQRIVAQIVTGIGFIGAGVIMKSDKQVTGLTTATTLWVSAIVGIILGSGYVTIGLIFGLAVVAFIYIRDFSRHINPLKKKNNPEE